MMSMMSSHEKVSKLFHELEARNTSIEKVEISVFHGTMASVIKKAAFQEQNELFTAELSNNRAHTVFSN